jgi:hypothetical protein
VTVNTVDYSSIGERSERDCGTKSWYKRSIVGRLKVKKIKSLAGQFGFPSVRTNKNNDLGEISAATGGLFHVSRVARRTK